MTMPHLELLVADRGRELRREAAAARLAALARCCRLSTWGRATRRATQAVLRLRAGRPGRPAAACGASA
jgi:hypothetical protein